ncbi:MAG: nicotinate-nucleotide adenylyltransferase [Coriobacteriales bacterium]|jgi:nicotinate-nucleotide adenylyltransferase|nr:nicotinate-nucleotide adenylyltransferase [Coriobacteriales bacterium]
MRRIGILGGTFDPVHNAHLELAHAARAQFDLECVMFLPTGKPARKLGTTQASAADRVQMLLLATEDYPHFSVSTMEVDRGGISYTIDSLREFKRLMGEGAELFLILGEDTATDLASWKDASEIAALAGVLYAQRPGEAEALPLPQGFSCQKLSMPLRAVSSTQIRELLAAGRDVGARIPPRVHDYIRRQGLYATPR